MATAVGESREDNVFMAQLAEQAERYDGLWFVLLCLSDL